MIAGSADVIGFLGLGGIFVAHITGNLIILAAYLVTGARVHVAVVLAVPVFVLSLILTRVLVARIEEYGIGSLRPLLLVQLGLLVGFLTLAVAGGTPVDPNAPTAVLAALFGVPAMGFATGAALGAGLYAGLGLAAVALPAALAFVALSAVHTSVTPRRGLVRGKAGRSGDRRIYTTSPPAPRAGLGR